MHAVKDIQPVSITENHANISNSNMNNSYKLHDLKTEMKSTNETPESVCFPDDWTVNVRNGKADNSLELNDEHRNMAEIPVLPDHPKDLYERSCKHISSTDTKCKL